MKRIIPEEMLRAMARSKEYSILFLCHKYGANHYQSMRDIRRAFEEHDGHCQAVHQGYYEDGTPFRVVMAEK